MIATEELLRNVRYGLRLMLRTPLVAFAIVLTLALGIGLDAGVFTIINGLVLRPRVERDPASFARVYADYSGRAVHHDFGGQMSLQAYRAFQAEAQSVEQLAAWSVARVNLQDAARQELGLLVSCNFFSVYGLDKPKLGRLFRADECSTPGSAAVAIISEELWTSRLNSDPQIVGKTLLLNRQPFTVVGVAPLNFFGRLRGPGVWVPYTMQAQLSGNQDRFRFDDVPWLWLEGRLRRGHSRAQFSAELNLIAARLDRQHSDIKTSILVTSGAMIEDPIVRQSAGWILLLIAIGLTLLLLVACANVAVLLLSRSVARRREVAVRISVGATHGRLLFMLITENLLLGFAAGAIALYLALQVPQVFRKLVPTMPYYPFTLDWHVFAYLVVITMLAVFLAAIAPARECMKQDVWSSLKGHETAFGAGRGRWSVRDLLTITQVAFSLVLMGAAAMFIRAERTVFTADPGLDTRPVLQLSLHLPLTRYSETASDNFYRSLKDRLLAMPGAESVAWSSSSPLATESEGASGNSFRLPGQTEGQGQVAAQKAVSANYFSSLGIPIVHGRSFRQNGEDDSSIVISQAFASAFWPGKDPLENTVVASNGTMLRVVGVASDTRVDHLGSVDGPHVYQLRSAPVRDDVLLVRFGGQARALEAAATSAVRALDPELVLAQETLRALLDDEAKAISVLADMLVFVAATAGGLALLGIYAIVAYSVSRRTREFGIRAALGATRRDIMRLVFSSGSKPVIAGMLVGVPLAIAGATAVAKVLAEAPIAFAPRDPLSYIFLCALMMLSALAAMVGHARRAARVEPVVALREE